MYFQHNHLQDHNNNDHKGKILAVTNNENKNKLKKKKLVYMNFALVILYLIYEMNYKIIKIGIKINKIKKPHSH